MKHSKIYFYAIITVLLIIIFSVNSELVFQSVKRSLSLCLKSVIPSLFPFFVLSGLLGELISSISICPTTLAYICSLLSGFPTGTKNVCLLFENKRISKKQAESLLTCTCNASPAYLIAYIGICICKNRSVGVILLLSQTICSAFCAFFFLKKDDKNNQITKEPDITNSICKSVIQATGSCLNVCGYISFMGIFADMIEKSILISKLSNIFDFLPQNNIKALAVGMIEISRGLSVIDPKKHNSIVLISALVGFSGISIIFQCISCAKSINITLNPINIIRGKIIYTIFMPIITFALIRIYKNIHIVKISAIFLFALFLISNYIVFDKLIKIRYNKIKNRR